MKQFLFRLSAWLLCVCLIASSVGVPPVQAEEPEAQTAVEITDYTLVTDSEGFTNLPAAFDGKEHTRPRASETACFTLSCEDGIGSLYLLFHREYGPYTITNHDTGDEMLCGTHGFLHEFIDLEGYFGAAPTSVTLRFESGAVVLDDIHAFTVGEPPAYVQRWEAPAEGNADLVLFSTHGDDEQLFFAGLLPYYANALDYRVQVVYLTNHWNTMSFRVHEMLNGLWAVGCTIHPVFGSYPDFNTKTLDSAYRQFQLNGHSQEEMLGFVVEQLRRFKPLVAVGHDFAGEYSHGQHMVYTDLLVQALEISNDPACYPESAAAYGLWDVPKTYIHLYKENPIVMDWDTPMEELGGMTPFEVTRTLGFPCHESQTENTWFINHILCDMNTTTKASDITKNSPCQFGLYRSTVGMDVAKNDMFENLTPYSAQTEPEPVPEASEPLPAETVPPAAPAPTPSAPAQQTHMLSIAICGIAAAAAVLGLIWWIKAKKRQ